jgi:hypothetical protein
MGTNFLLLFNTGPCKRQHMCSRLPIPLCNQLSDLLSAIPELIHRVQNT